MTRNSSKLFAGPVIAFVLLTFSANGQGLHTTQRTIHSYAYGDRTYTCLAIDGGEVPLIAPAGATVEAGDEIKLLWPKDGSVAVFRPASPGEAALLDQMDKQEGPDLWKRHAVSTLRGGGYQYTVHDLQPDILAVNHWRIGAISMDYALAGLKSTSLLMVWRCKDGTNIAVNLQAGADHFKAHCDELYSMIGGAMLMARQPGGAQ